MTPPEKELHAPSPRNRFGDAGASLPENLRQKFAVLERRLWKIETTTAVCIVVAGFALAFLALFVSDRFWDSPVWVRALIAGLSLVALVSSMVWWSKRWIFQRRDLPTLSQLVQKKFARLGDRLLGIVELSSEQRPAANFSPELYRAAIHQVAEEAERFDFQEAIDSRRAKKIFGGAVALAVLALLFCALAPAAGKNVLARWLAPTARIERFTFVNLANLPDKLIVPHGEPFTVAAAVEYRSFWKPSRARARLERQAKIGGDVKNGRVSFSVPGQLQSGALKIKIGDAEKIVTVEPTFRPSLHELSAAIELPDYLQYPPLEESVRGGVLAVLEGSKVLFHGRANRELSEAKLSVDDKDFSPLKIDGEKFTSQSLKRDGIFQLAFSWCDNFGLTNAPPLRLAVQTKPDAPPVSQLADLGRDLAMLYTDVLEIKTFAQDDFGVRSVGLSWEITGAAEQAESVGTTELRKEMPSRQEQKVERTFSWSPVAFQIPPDSTVELTAYAKDFFPDRERVYSQPCRIYVLGNEKHADFLRQKLDSVFMQLEEVGRLEEKVAANTEALQAMTNSPQAAEKLENAKNDQQRNTAHLDELAKAGMRTLQEALKNPIFSEQVVSDWSKSLQAMRKLSQQQMKQAAGSLGAAKQSLAQNNPAQRDENLAAAKAKEEEAIQALAQMQQKINKQLDELQALTLSSRLRQVASSEGGIESDLQKNVAETIGLLPRELPDKFIKINTALATVQTNVQTEAQTLQNEINRFFERTQKQNYGDVAREMTEAKTMDGLEHVSGLILENVAVEASKNSAAWSKYFGDWADKLEPKESDSPGGSGSGSGSGKANVDVTKTLVALLRMRESENNLRSQTRLIDELKAEGGGYKSSARQLASTQGRLAEELAALHMNNPIGELDETFGDAFQTMRRAKNLLVKPQTDDATVAEETRAIENLSDLINLINEQAKRSNPNPAASESESDEAAFLMQMAQGNQKGQGMPSNRSGDPNRNGGTTDRAAISANGEATGRAPGERKLVRVSGAAQNGPVEFRETLENYFKAIESETP